MAPSGRNWRAQLGMVKSHPRLGYAREMEFQRVRKKAGRPVERASVVFTFTRARYIPDFYSREENAYYEVIGSRSRALDLLGRERLLGLGQ